MRAPAWSAPPPIRMWWLGGAVIILLERAATFGFFIPTALALMNGRESSETRAVSAAQRWIVLNRVRAMLNWVGWLAALKALSLLGVRGA